MNQTKLIPFEDYLIKRDSTEAFIHYYCRKKYYRHLRYRHIMATAVYRLGLLSTQRFHHMLLKDVMRGMHTDRFNRVAKEFAAVHLDRYMHMPHITEVLELKSQGHDVVIQSKGMEEWVKPWCDKFGIRYVEAHRAEIDQNGKLTGEILAPASTD